MNKPPESEMSKHYRMCGSKRKYRTAAEAQDNGSRVYQCPYCKGWHRTQVRKRRKP